MDSQGRYNNQHCPCYDVQKEFQKIANLKNTGLVIYRRRSQVEYVEKPCERQPSTKNNEEVFVLHNTKDTDILSTDIIVAFDNYAISCPRCVHIIKNAKRILEMVQNVQKNSIIGICAHCRKRLTSCMKCEKAVKRFVSTKDVNKDIKERYQTYSTKTHRSLTDVIGERKTFKKSPSRTFSDLEICSIHHNSPATSSQEPIIGDVFDLDATRSAPNRTMPFPTESSRDKKRTTFLDLPDDTISRPFLDSADQNKKHKAQGIKHGISYLQSLDNVTYHHDPLLAREINNLDNSDLYFGSENSLLAHDLNKKLKFEKVFPYKESKTVSEKNHKKPSVYAGKLGLGKSTPDMQSKELDEISGQLAKKYNSAESFFDVISNAVDDSAYSDLTYYFPKEIDVKLKKPVKIISSSELINDTQTMLRDRAEKERIKREEDRKRKQEEKEEKRKEKEKQRLFAEEQQRKLEEEAKKLAEEEKKILSAKQAQDQMSYAARETSSFSESRLKKPQDKNEIQIKEKETKESYGDKLIGVTESNKGRKQFKTELKKQKSDMGASHAKTIQSVEPKQKIKDSTSEKRQGQSKTKIEPKELQKPKMEADIKDQIREVDKQKYKKDVKDDNLAEKDKIVPDITDKQKLGRDIKSTKVDDNIKIEKDAKDDVSKKEKDITKGKQKQVDAKDDDVSKKEKSITRDKQKRGSDDVQKTTGKQTPGEDLKPTAEKTKIGKEKADTDSPKSKTKDQVPVKQTNDKATADEFKKLLEQQKKQAELEQKQKKQQEEEERKLKEAAEKKLAESGQKPAVTAKSKKSSPKKESSSSPLGKKNATKSQEKDLSMGKIKMKQPSGDDLLLRLVKLHQLDPRKPLTDSDKQKKIKELLEKHKMHKVKASCLLCKDPELELELERELASLVDTKEILDIIIGEKIYKITAPTNEKVKDQHITNLKTPDEGITKINEDTEDYAVPNIVPETVDLNKPLLVTTKGTKTVEQEPAKGVIRYALSDRTFIDKGWTLLPTEKVVRKMNVYRMRPAHPEFDWFEHNKSKRLMQYDSGEKLAEFNDNGRGRWFYKNGRVALDYYDAEETNAQQRFVVYSSGEPDERGRSRPFTILATFDYLGNGVVFDHAGKIRLKYNQTEGVVLDRAIGPVSHWKWHTLNDPPVLQQVMIDTQMPFKDPTILKMGKPGDDKPRPDNEEMLAIEFDNFIKEKSKKLTQTFKPFQIKMKALKINEQFSLKVLDQATIYLIFRDGSANLKLNLGMILDHKEIVDTDTAEVGEVSNSLERLPARTDSIAGLQSSVAYAQRIERKTMERERRLRPRVPTSSADRLTAAASRPMRPPFRTVTSDTTVSCVCKCRKPSSSNLYYDTRLM